MAKNNNLGDFLKDIADTIRAKKGTTGTINPQNFSSEIESIQTGTDTSDATATASDLLSGKTAYGSSGKITGTLQKQTKSVNIVTNKQTIISPDAGKLLETVVVTTNVQPVTQEKAVDLAMASGNQVVTPDSDKTLSKVTVNKPATLLPENIKKDVVIGGVTGTLAGEANPIEVEDTSSLNANDLGKFFVNTTTDEMFRLTNDAALYWLNSITGISGTIQDVCYGSDRFVCVGFSSAYYSFDGKTWVAMSGLPSSMAASGVVYDGSKFICVGQSSNKCYYCTDGETWSEGSTLHSTKSIWSKITYLNNILFAHGDGIMLYSTDGETWTECNGITSACEAIAYGNNKYVSVGGYRSAISDDGITWTQYSGGIEHSISVAFCNDRFVKSNDQGKPFYSSDGITWTAVTASIPYTCRVINVRGFAYLVGTDGYGEAVVAYTTDFSKWYSSYANNVYFDGNPSSPSGSGLYSCVYARLKDGTKRIVVVGLSLIHI